MTYSVFCSVLTLSLSACLEPGIRPVRDTIRKNNGVSHDVLILNRYGRSPSPVIYLEPLYEMYRSGSTVDAIVTSVLSRTKCRLPFSPEICLKSGDLDTVKDRIAFRLISKERNEELLASIPWIPFLDLSIVFFLSIESGSDSTVTALIPNHLLNSWGLSPSELFSIAKVNTPILFPSVISRIEDLIFEKVSRNETTSSPETLPSPFPVSSLHVLTNSAGLYGAACMLYENEIKDFASLWEADVIILPSSIHEVLLMPDFQLYDYDGLSRMVTDINKAEVPEEDILSDHIYLYSRAESSFRIWSSACFCRMP